MDDQSGGAHRAAAWMSWTAPTPTYTEGISSTQLNQSVKQIGITPSVRLYRRLGVGALAASESP